MLRFKHVLTLLAIFTICGACWKVALAQAPVVSAAPAEAVESKPLEPIQVNGPVVVELFSSQACLFCPEADAYLNTLAQKENIIPIACHVDYFDIKDGSLAQPFCTQRQTQYSRTLRSGPKFTPQMVINGKYSAIGYKKDKVDAAVYKAASKNIGAITITPVKEGEFSLNMPTIETGQYSIWVAVTNKPIVRSLIVGKNKGKSVRYYHIVSDLTSPMIWSGDARNFSLSVNLGKTKQSVAVFAQNQVSGEITAAGQYIIAEPE